MTKASSEKSMLQWYGETFVELGKLTFAGVVLGAVLRTDISDALLILSGVIVCIVCVVTGVTIIHYKKKK